MTRRQALGGEHLQSARVGCQRSEATPERRNSVASVEFAHWLLRLHAIIDIERPEYPRDPDSWRPYFNLDYEPREALEEEVRRNSALK